MQFNLSCLSHLGIPCCFSNGPNIIWLDFSASFQVFLILVTFYSLSISYIILFVFFLLQDHFPISSVGSSSFIQSLKYMLCISRFSGPSSLNLNLCPRWAVLPKTEISKMQLTYLYSQTRTLKFQVSIFKCLFDISTCTNHSKLVFPKLDSYFLALYTSLHHSPKPSLQIVPFTLRLMPETVGIFLTPPFLSLHII